MARRKTHTEKWWDAAPPHTLRCTGHNKTDGSRCRAEAAPGTTVCDRHGALIPAVQAAAARRVQMSVDEAAQRLITWMNDDSVDMRERVKIAHDLLDRGGLAATSKHLVGVVGGGDPVETLFLDLLSTPGALVDPASQRPLPPDPEQLELNRRADPEAALEFADLIGPVDVVDAELVEDYPSTVASSASRHPRGPNPAKPPKHIRDDLERLGLL